MFLTPDELVQLTGYRLPAWQIRWLARNGIAHTVNRLGRPVVTRSAVEARHGVGDRDGFRLGEVR